jgi:plastocyanin
MNKYRMITALSSTAMFLLVALPVVAQVDSSQAPSDMDVPTIDVSGVDYAYVGLPTSVPAGTTLTFTNDGTEVHEMVVVRIDDETTPLEELMAMPESETADISEDVGALFAFPGMAAEGSITVDAPGRYVALCFVSQGSDPAAFEAVGFDPSQMDADTDPSTLPPAVQELLASIESNPPHMALGMIQEFRVTEAGTEVGPLPASTPDPMAADEEESASG